MKKILLTGGSGQLGTELIKLRQYLTPSRHEMNIISEESVENYLTTHDYSLIIHAAAYTNVHLPESNPQEAFLCYSTNVLGTRYIVKFTKSPIIFISTETVLNPYNFYNLTKLQAENEVKKCKKSFSIIRTSFRNNPFEYEMAPDDMLTIGDSVEIIAKLIDKFCDLSMTNDINYVGTGVKTMYELAIKTRKNVKRGKITDIPFPISNMCELLNIPK
jgi:dTDP-4-dehydrorhamnose reductase